MHLNIIDCFDKRFDSFDSFDNFNFFLSHVNNVIIEKKGVKETEKDKRLSFNDPLTLSHTPHINKLLNL